MSTHTCHAINCNTRIPPEMLMCKRHWFMVPKSIQRQVWNTYRPGQCDDWRPSQDYCDAAKSAVMYVAIQENIPITGQEPELVMYDLFRKAAEDGPEVSQSVAPN